MDDDRWRQLVGDIEGEDIEAMVDASERLSHEADATDIPRLLELLTHDDFVVREAAAWPLARVGGSDVLAELFSAYQKGFDEGHDNDGFSAALVALAELNPERTREKLLELRESSDGVVNENATWLLEFC